MRAELARNLPPVAGDESQLRQVIHNLLQNAEDALVDHDEGIVTLTTRQDGERVALVIGDNGPGFPAQVLTHAFEPYFTTKSRGTGLGLAMVKKIIDEHGGEIRLMNRETGGAEVRLRLRLATPTSDK
jgi:C4-dicarboxylate-specific signal transduction histidine kinase